MQALEKLNLVGLNEQEAKSLLQKSGINYRVVQRDGHYLMVTQDFKPDRINLVINDDKVSSFNCG